MNPPIISFSFLDLQWPVNNVLTFQISDQIHLHKWSNRNKSCNKSEQFFIFRIVI